MKHKKSINYRKSMWGIRAGKNGDAHELFINRNLIVLSDANLGDLMRLDPSRDAFYFAYRKKHLNATKSEIAGIGGKFFRFVYEVKIKDSILYPSIKDKLVVIGRVLGNYVFDKSPDPKFPHHRSVRWEYYLPKSSLSEAARRELGAARTFFKYKNNREEIRSFITKGIAKRFST